MHDPNAFLLPLREKVARAAGRMRGRDGLSDSLFAGTQDRRRDPSSVGFAATFSHKGRRALFIGLLFIPGLAHAAAVDAYYERSVMAAADQRCHLFTGNLAAALGASQAQARGAAMRAGVSTAQLDNVQLRAYGAAGSAACNSNDITTAANRVRLAFDGYSKLQTMSYRGDVSSWWANRASSDNYTTWRLSQTEPFGWNTMIFGIGGRGADTGLLAVASFVDGARPYSARLVLRDVARAPEPFLNVIRASSDGRIPLSARMPPASATRAFFPQARGDADRMLLPAAAISGTAFRFPNAAADVLARLDPRESVAVEFLFSSGQTVRTAYVEVGDFAAGRAFLASAQR